ncbi:MAG: D-glycero-alpha-D-manno-heptose-1,7-bisphosphate 7-phosphatase [Candidatus Kapaibacterium sp.]|jgi:D-glycero-D-manno-heptose 1,7-bisphosphate phosphatase
MHDTTKNKAIFFDRDGIINRRKIGGYITTTEEFVFIPDFFTVFAYTIHKNYIPIVITNQQGIGKGLMTIHDLRRIHTHMQQHIRLATGADFDDIRFCTSLAQDNDQRRKPNPGMITESIQQWNINPQQSWMIGDSQSDIIAAQAAGVRTIYIGNSQDLTITTADHIFASMSELNENLHRIIE